MSNSERKSKGRQKIPMVRMQKQSNRLVTFSKRRLGLFKKASELCTLCGANAAVVVFSPGRKAFSFGHPSVDAVLSRFMYGNRRRAEEDDVDEDGGNDDVAAASVNVELGLLNDRVDAEMRHTEELLEERRAKGGESPWLDQVDQMSPANLVGIMGSMTRLRDIIFQFGQMMVQQSAGPSNNPTDPMGSEGLFGGQSSSVMIPNPNPTPMGGVQHSSVLAMGSNPMGGFDAPNVPGFGGGGQFDGPYSNPTTTAPANFGFYTSLLMGENSPTGASNDAYN